MVFRHFRLMVLLRVVGIVATSLALAWSIYETSFLMTPIVFGLFTLLQAMSLVLYLEKSTKHLNSFIQAFADQDFTRKFEPSYQGKAFKELSDTFNNLLDTYAKLSIEKEGQYQYVKQINEHVQVALISFKGDGKIDLMNKRAQELLGSPFLYRVSDIGHYAPKLRALLSTIGSDEKVLYKHEHMSLAVVAKQFKLGADEYTLVAIQDISNELQLTELASWQKLIKVLTHEIMNSMTPVLSLSTAIKNIVSSKEGVRVVNSLSQEEVNDIHRSISAIENRGTGLLQFVNAYRDYTKTPTLELLQVHLEGLTNEVLTLFQDQLKQKGIALTLHVADKLQTLTVDPKLITQVIINLLKNAMEAVAEVNEPEISLRLTAEDGHQHLSIMDNGPGIPDELSEDIFVPFFTTKKKGTGIGLSLSQQIIKAHKGAMVMEDTPGKTCFTLSLPTVP